MATFRSILVAADFSEPSRESFRVACALAEETRTRMLVLHVAETPLASGEMGMPIPLAAADPATRAGLEDRLRESYAPTRPIDVEHCVCDGLAVEQILRVAGEFGADLIALGTHGRGGLRRLVVGSVAEDVLRRAGCPVLGLHLPADRQPSGEAIRVILHPTDLSGPSRDALRVARHLARDLGARLFVLHVKPSTPSYGTPMTAITGLDAVQEALDAIPEIIEGPDLKYPVETRLRPGDAGDEILRMADELEADLIVMGSHGRTGLGRMLMGSVAESVLRRTGYPALIVKPASLEPGETSHEPGRAP
jgi:nucleotide-binding universal stress UspA family protein